MPLAQPSLDRALVAPPALEEVFRAHATFVWRVLCAHGVARADVQDAAQEVFLIVHRKLDQWDPARGAMTTWLYGIAMRVAANYRRRAARHSLPERDPAEPVETPDPVESIERARRLQRFHEALMTLEPSKRDVFIMFEIGQVSMQEIARKLGCALKTAYKRLYAARRELARKLESEGGEP